MSRVLGFAGETPRAIVAVCADVEGAREKLLEYWRLGLRPKCYQRNIHAEVCDVYVHVIVADVIKEQKSTKKGKRT